MENQKNEELRKRIRELEKENLRLSKELEVCKALSSDVLFDEEHF